MTSPARDVALDVLLAVHERGAYANLALDGELSREPLATRDAALATELAYGALRSEGTLDWVLAGYSSRGLADLAPQLLDVLRLAAYQILYMDVPDHAAVNEAVNQARTRLHQGAASYANAVLRALAAGRDGLDWPSPEADWEEHISIKLWHPKWLVTKWAAELGREETEKLCRADNAPPVLCLRVNTLRTRREELLEEFHRRAIDADAGLLVAEAIKLRRAGALADLPEHAAGLVYAQDEGSMAVSHALAPKPRETVVDLCAAPGGKATHLAELMRNRGRVLAVDLNLKRLGLVNESAKRLGDAIIETVQADATSWRPSKPADRVLLDAPCSGLGVLARRAEARWRKRPEDILKLADLQARLLDNAAEIVKGGGALVYSTCTISRAENQDQAAAFLSRHADFKPGNPTEDLGIAAPSGPGWMQLLPHTHGTDGIFIAKFLRKR